MARALAATFPWERYGTVVDVGCAEGAVPVQLALAHDHLGGGGFDLPLLEPVFDDYVGPSASGTAWPSTPATSSPMRCPSPTCS